MKRPAKPISGSTVLLINPPCGTPDPKSLGAGVLVRVHDDDLVDVQMMVHGVPIYRERLVPWFADKAAAREHLVANPGAFVVYPQPARS
jgi:hypothetical protein